MAFVAANDVYLSVDGTDISQYCGSIETNYTIDSLDTTTFSAGGRTYQGGMTDGTLSLSGTYDDTASGPKAVVEPLMRTGLLVEAVYRPEGTGSGKPQQTFDVLVTSYSESSAVGDMIRWSSEMQVSGPVVDATQ
jgi:hypothetical protein